MVALPAHNARGWIGKDSRSIPCGRRLLLLIELHN